MAPKMIFGIKTTEPQIVAFARYRGPFQIPAALTNLDRWIERQGYHKIGPPTTIYYSNQDTTPAEKLEWEVQFAIGDKVPRDRLVLKTVSGVKKVKPITVAYTYFKGPFDEVGPVYGALWQWMVKKGYLGTGIAREINWGDEATTPKERLMTEVQLPIRIEQKKPRKTRGKQ